MICCKDQNVTKSVTSIATIFLISCIFYLYLQNMTPLSEYLMLIE